MAKTTISVIKADIGSYPGHVVAHPHLEDLACNLLQEAKDGGLIKDFRVTHCGDDLELIMSHGREGDSEEVHEL
ncbi:MAG: fructose 1,6-bisphosphatase, partial [Thermoplasmata archaeon]